MSKLAIVFLLFQKVMFIEQLLCSLSPQEENWKKADDSFLMMTKWVSTYNFRKQGLCFVFFYRTVGPF